MKRIYKNPEIDIKTFACEEVATASSTDATVNALKTGGLKVNGRKLDIDANIVSVNF